MEISVNINTKEYWESRFAGGDWEKVGGNTQTSMFARAQAKRIQLPPEFDGGLLDFGCGEGDAAPVFHKAWPRARLVGIDFSKSAIECARSRYGDLAEFMVGSHEDCPAVDVIVASNVMEHLDDDMQVVGSLVRKCRDLYVVVPFEEQFLIEEHVRRYDRTSFSAFDVVDVNVFPCRGWSHYGLRNRWWNIHAKNFLRPFFGRVRLNRRLQAMFHIKGSYGS